MADKKSKLTLVKFNKTDLSKGRHVLIVESPESKRAVSLNVSVFSMGRHPNNDLVISNRLASRHHATIAWMKYSEGENRQDFAYWIIDGKGKRKRSRNGIYINGKKKSLHRLKNGDEIAIGDDVKINYSYIAYTKDNQEFLEYCDHAKPQYSTPRDVSYSDTIINL